MRANSLFPIFTQSLPNAARGAGNPVYPGCFAGACARPKPGAQFQPSELPAALIRICLLVVIIAANCAAQTPPAKKDSRAATPENNPAQIELLETKYRFETNGDSRKEVHALVKINNEIGARQFARLNFDFNRSFQSVEIPLVRVNHAGGGVADILPSAITDTPNPAVVDFPAYHDVRVKSVRILGLQPDDTLEYRVITTTTHHPLAPDFWLDHTFDRSGVVSKEIFELNLPSPRKSDIRVNPATPAASTKNSGEGDASGKTYRWERKVSNSPKDAANMSSEPSQTAPDVAISTEAWEPLSISLEEKLTPRARPREGLTSDEEIRVEADRKQHFTPEAKDKALEITKFAKNNREKLEALYEFVSRKITTVDLPLGSTAFVARPVSDVLASGYATPEDKFVLFAALAAPLKFSAVAGLTGFCDEKAPARPTVFNHLLIYVHDGENSVWLDPSLEVAPFAVIPPNTGNCAFLLNRSLFVMNATGHEWQQIRAKPPFSSKQKVSVGANFDATGTLKAKVHYALRGDHELLLRVAFHKTAKDKWKDVAQLLAISDGFRGEITNVTASDPYETREPFTVEYEISQPKFADFSRKTVRLPALLPAPGLPDATNTSTDSSGKKMIDLGTPMEIELDATLQLPEGTRALAPTGTAVERDYATFSSKYSAQGNTLHATRKLNFRLREIPPTRAADLNAFLHAVQADQAQLFTITSPKN